MQKDNTTQRDSLLNNDKRAMSSSKIANYGNNNNKNVDNNVSNKSNTRQ